MNQNLKNLFEIASKPERRIIGVNCGTSLDGLDIALCSFQGAGISTRAKLLQYKTLDYSDQIKNEIRKVFAKPQIQFQDLCLLNSWIGTLNGEMILECLTKWRISPKEVDVIASHGQTVFHAPKFAHCQPGFENSTLQIGDGDHIAVKTGVITFSDFRQKHVAAGGEGAPLAVYSDYVLLAKENENRILLNIGGIANFSFLPGITTEFLQETDTGPGNTLIDAYTRSLFNQPYDKDGEIAGSGTVNIQLLKELKNDEFFKKPFPKTTGPELFNVEFVTACMKRCGIKENQIRPEDLLATLTRFTAETIHEGIRECIADSFKARDDQTQKLFIYTSGGGNHNKVLMKQLEELLPDAVIQETDVLGIPGDAKEAVLFAVLANEALCGDSATFSSAKIPNVSMGKISFPN